MSRRRRGSARPRHLQSKTMVRASLNSLLCLLGLVAFCSGWQLFNQRLAGATNSVPTSISDASKSIYRDAARTAGVIVAASLVGSLEVLAEDKPKKLKKPKVLETELGIKYIELKKGSGPLPRSGDFVVVDYTAFLNNGTVWDSTEIKGRKQLSFRMGLKQTIPGLESVIEYMQPGGEATCVIPPQFAYGAKGVCLPNDGGCLVPPNETLKYAIKLRNVGAGYN